MSAAAAEEEEDEERGGLLRSSKRRSWARWVREGNLDTLLPLVVLSVLSVCVVVYNSVRQQWEPCETDRPLAKHFYCYNASKPPGFHLDTPAG